MVRQMVERGAAMVAGNSRKIAGYSYLYIDLAILLNFPNMSDITIVTIHTDI